MTPERDETPQAMHEGYWSEIDAVTETVVDGIEEAETDWTIHAVVLSGESDSAHFAVVVRSRVGNSGLLLSERMVRIPKDAEGPEDIGFTENGIHRRVSGPLARALTRAYARADNDDLASNELESDPLALSAIGTDVEENPEELGPFKTHPHDEIRERREQQQREQQPDCEKCGKPVDPEHGVNMGGGGLQLWVHDNCSEVDDGKQ